MNIVEPILFQARCQPEAPALCAQGRNSINYARLTAQMNNVARRAMACGLKRGDVVALSILTSCSIDASFSALHRWGIVSVSVAMQKPPDGLEDRCRDRQHCLSVRSARATLVPGQFLDRG